MEILIRPATEQDMPSVLEIVNYEITHSTVNYSYSEDTLDNQLDWFRKKQLAALPVMVAERAQQVLGFGTYGPFRPKDAYQYSVEHSVYVAKEARGQGIGQLLLQELIRRAREQGYHTMIAGVDGSNQGSYHFHRKLGFVEVGRFREVGYKFDQWLDLIFLQLFLQEDQGGKPFTE